MLLGVYQRRTVALGPAQCEVCVNRPQPQEDQQGQHDFEETVPIREHVEEVAPDVRSRYDTNPKEGPS